MVSGMEYMWISAPWAVGIEIRRDLIISNAVNEMSDDNSWKYFRETNCKTRVQILGKLNF